MMAFDLRVAHVVLSLEPGGTEKLVVDLAARCARQVQTRVYCLDTDGEWAKKLAAIHIPVDVVGRQPGFDIGTARRLRRLAHDHRIDVFHCHQYSPMVYGVLAALPFRRPRVVFTEHGRADDAPPSPRRRAVNRVLWRLPAAITAVSAELRDFMMAEGFPGGSITVVHNGIDPGPERTAATRAAVRLALGFDERDFVIGTAARLDPVKDLGTAIDAIAEVKKRHSRTVFVVIGDGAERQNLTARIDALGLSDAVRFLGYRADVRELLAGFDAYLNTSIFEGISVTILEAMAASLPVIATAVGGTPEVVVEEETGLLVARGDAAGAGRALARLAAAPEGRARMGNGGRARVVKWFSFERMFAHYFAEYTGAAAGALKGSI